MAHTKKMLSEDWIAVQDNPIQRDTEKHARKAKHLLAPHPTHSVVHAAELPGGRLVKLDGHTRALLWKRRQVAAPMQVTVVVYPVKDMREVEQLYKDFDSSLAVEGARDKVSGAFGKHNFDPQSGLLQTGSITQALRTAYGVLIGGSVKTATAGGASQKGETGKDRRSEKQIATQVTDIYTMIDEFSYELHALDGFGLGSGAITAGLMAAFIISYRRYGHKVTPFWGGVFGGKGSKIDGQMDAIQAVEILMVTNKGKSGRMHVADMAARCLRAVEGWLKDEMFFRQPTPLNTNGYLVGYGKPTERLIKASDKHNQGLRA